jgi:hypothetical protein
MGSKKKAAGPDPREAILAVLRKHGSPKPGGAGLAFTREGDALFERGYPEMRFLSDESIPKAKAIKTAEDALDAIDPAFRITVPREVARRYLLGHSVGTGLFVDEHAHARERNAKLRVERAAKMASDDPIDTALLQTALDAQGFSMGDTYSRWRWPKVIYLYEAFLGTEPVARVVTAHLVREADDLSRWGFAGKDCFRANAAPHYIALTLPWLMKRLEPSVAAELRASLSRARPPAPTPAHETEPWAYLALLRAISGEPLREQAVPIFGFDLALRGDDPAPLAARVASSPHNFFWFAGRLAWMLGTAGFAEKLNVSGYDHARMIDSVAPIEDAGVVRFIAAIASQRAGKKAAAAWLRAHAAHARPILKDLATLSDPKEKSNAENAIALMDDETPVGVHVPTPEELEREIAKIFSALKKKLTKTKDVDAQKEAIRAAYEKYTEARAAAGDPIPEAYFTHRFGDFDMGEWGMLAVDAID